MITYSPTKIIDGSNCLARLGMKLDKTPEDPNALGAQGIFGHRVFQRYAQHCEASQQATDADAIGGIAETEYRHSLRVELNVGQYREMQGMVKGFANRMVFDKPIIGIEHRIAILRDGELCPWDDPDCMVRGIIDLIEEGGATRVRITDYKTGYDTSVGKLQLQIYAWMVGQYLRHIQEIEVRIMFVRWGAVKAKVYTRAQCETAGDQIKARIDLFDKLPRDEWVATPGEYCTHCPFAMQCPHKQTTIAGQMIKDEAAARKVVEDLAQLDARTKALKAGLRAYIEGTGKGVKRGGNYWNFHAVGQLKPRSAVALFHALAKQAKAEGKTLDFDVFLGMCNFNGKKAGELKIGKGKEKRWPDHLLPILIEDQAVKFDVRKYKEDEIDVSQEVDTDALEGIA